MFSRLARRPSDKARYPFLRPVPGAEGKPAILPNGGLLERAPLPAPRSEHVRGEEPKQLGAVAWHSVRTGGAFARGHGADGTCDVDFLHGQSIASHTRRGARVSETTTARAMCSRCQSPPIAGLAMIRDGTQSSHERGQIASINILERDMAPDTQQRPPVLATGSGPVVSGWRGPFR